MKSANMQTQNKHTLAVAKNVRLKVTRCTGIFQLHILPLLRALAVDVCSIVRRQCDMIDNEKKERHVDTHLLPYIRERPIK
jgi:hypothetical protein